MPDQWKLEIAPVRNDRRYRYGGVDEIDPVFNFRERSRVLLLTPDRRGKPSN